MKCSGWFNESYRHSLASKGVRTSLVANSRKGWRSKPEDLVWSDKHNRFVDWRKVAAAEGIETGNKRKHKKGDTFEVPMGVDIYEGMPEEEQQPAFTSFESLPRQTTLPVTPPLVQEFTGPPRLPEEFREAPTPISQYPTNLSEQQAQPVEEELPAMGALSPPYKKQETSTNFLPFGGSIEESLGTIPKISTAAKTKRDLQ